MVLAVAALRRRAKLIRETSWVPGHEEGVALGQVAGQHRPDVIGFTDEKPVTSVKIAYLPDWMGAFRCTPPAVNTCEPRSKGMVNSTAGELPSLAGQPPLVFHNVA